ncbi:glycosyltransferase family 4 protein [Butyrivibrio proteoclasticus]|uniref:glycosyltransferase family 4 protein n=1 Tax=Butyrivibrio proteoclasticus TaxID=43305 RepID=UPI0004792F88|nr:glycosyltransferase family 4 protein [Butyrivibrio proteoclasticus]
MTDANSNNGNLNMNNEKGLKILVVTECFWPDIYAVNDIVEKLVQKGHRVTVLTGLPDYTTTRIPPEYKHGKNRHQNYKGADVYRVPTIARRHGPIFRSLSYLSFAFNGKFRALTQDFKHTDVWGKTSEDADFDVIYVWEVSPVTMAVPAIALKKRYHKPLFLYCMDIWPECVKAMSIKEGTLPYRMIHAWTKRIYKACDHIAVSSEPFFEYLQRVNGIGREKMSYLPQYADAGLLSLDTKKTPDGRTDFLFIGNIGKAQNVDCLIRAMSVFKGRNDVTLHMVGGGSAYEDTVALVKELSLEDQVIFYGPKPFKEAVAFYTKADACVLTLDGSTRIGDTLPGKLQTYMAAGKTILAAANGAASDIIGKAQCGKCVTAGDDVAYGQALLDFADNKDKYADCGDKGRDFFRDNFMEDQHFETLIDKLREMSGK